MAKKNGPLLKDSIQIKAPAAKVFAGLTTGNGIAGWFSDKATTQPCKGGSIEMTWNHGGMGLQSKFITFTKNREASYTFYGTDVVKFTLARQKGVTIVSLEHQCSPDSPPQKCIDITQNWAHLLWMLKWRLETGKDSRK
jgi:uncharacterized protein YndB with AHSA1/START domain